MKFEKKQLLDITFQKFMDLGLGEGNLNMLEDIVAQDVVGFGTTIDEKLFGVRELQSLLIRQKEQSAGMDLSWKINTLDIHISADENSAIFTNEIVLYITENENPIEMYMRFSVVLEYVQNKWIVVHWHGSKPEHVESEKDTWGIQTWKEKAESLEKEVAERTADLVEKNKELSIEAALEKVRSVAMGMKKPEDMLDVCRNISDQLQQFGVSKIRNVQTAIIDENIGQYLCYQFFPAYDQTTIEDTDYHKSPVEREMVREMLASRDGHFIGSLIGERLEEFRSHRKEENHFPDPLLDEASEVSYCFLSIGEGGLGMSLYQAMDEGILTLFKRFHQVFSLAYQRFRDIQKAEAQAREAQIEVAVERVRAQSMAMHHPNDLDKVNKEILTQLNWLQIQGLSGVTFYLVDQDGWVKAWDFSSPGNIGDQKSYTLQFDFKKYEMMGYPFKIFQQTDLNYLVADYPLEKLEKAVFEIEEINPEVATVVKEALAKGMLTHQWSACARITDGLLAIDLVSPPSEDTKTIVLKIAGAFNQAYQRFLDLQKAEAHARESEIDLALERVRAQTMAMHSSEDVGKCIVKMFSELTALGVDEGTRFGIGILNHDNENNQLWTARKNGDEVNMHIGNIDMASHPLLKSARKAWKEQVPLHKYVLEGEDLVKYYQMLNNAPDYKIQIPIEKLPKKEIQHCFIFEHGFFYAFSPREFQPELIHITKRFSSLFEQTYRRYLDLVRAEAQAREAEIELALERVRARTMAMYHTEELKDVIQVVFDQFVGLNIQVEHAGFILDYKEREDMHIWLADHNQGVPREITIPFFDSPHWNSFLESKARQESFFANLLPLEVKNKFYRDLFKWIPELTEEAQQTIFSKPALAISTVLLDNVGLYIEHYSETPFSAEENTILMRFGNVFQQTYTRFLDLQKAEAQAREAQIQLALERVRASTMAMHKSTELAEVAVLLYQELKSLGVSQDFFECGYVEVDEAKNIQRGWSTRPDGSLLEEPFYLPLTGEPVSDSRYKAWIERVPVFHQVVGGEQWQRHLEFVLPYFGNKAAIGIATSSSIPDPLHFYCGNFDHGYLHINCGVALSVEEESLLARLTGVFEMTYRRFLDLQKAEAQAREAQIEAALERVRSRSMAMHKSEELLDAGEIIFVEMQKLGIESLTAGLVLMDNEEKNGLNYTPDPSTQKMFPLPVIIPHDETRPMQQVVENWKKGNPFFIVEMDEDETIQHQTFIAERSTNFSLTAAQLIAISPARLFLHNFYFKEGYVLIVGGTKLSGEQTEIMLRFAKVFQQTYTRFLDLQKAEAQAREAQIEAALEKVRSRSLAMHKSDELNEVVMELFERLNDLQIPVTAVGISINIEDSKDLDNYTCGLVESGIAINNYRLPYFDHRIANDFFEAREKQLDFFVGHYSKQEKDSFYEYVINHTELKNELTEDIKQFIFQSPSYSISVVTTKNTMITLNDFEGKSLSVDEIDILKRFSKVFEQTYTRFLDLQKAEAQTREAQIEAALERVRSRSLAMHKTSELQSVIHTVHHELLNLNISISGGSFIVINSEIDNEIHCWGSGGTADTSDEVHIPHFDKPFYTHLLERIKNGPGFFTEEYSQDEKIEFFTFLFQHEPWSKLSAKEKNNTLSAPGGYTRSCAVAKHTSIFIINHFGERFSEAENAILKRFGKVFEQSYTRFLDLQKAEDQAREAQIEAALERVRSRSMAMHKSEEFPEVIQVVFEQFQQLDFKIDSAQFDVSFRETDDLNLWAAVPGQPYPAKLHIPYADNAVFNSIKNAKKAGHDFVFFQFTKEQKNEFFKYFFLQVPNIPEERKKLIFSSPGMVRSAILLDNVSLAIQNYSGIAYSDAEHAILKRFAKAFEQIYTRFLDLQKAEAQAKEAQIEAALERVRSRSLAMHHSSELSAVVDTLLREFTSLEFTLTFCIINLINEQDKSNTVWAANPETGKDPESYYMKFEDYPFHHAMWDAWKAQEKRFVYTIEGKEKKIYDEYLYSETEFRRFPKHVQEANKALDRYVAGFTFFKYSGLQTVSIDPISEDELEILERFGKVFEQSYTRFLDLQNAEAQTRESQIQLALERVRARTMAMQHSDELPEAANLLFQQVQSLGMPAWSAGYCTWNDDEKWAITLWMSSEGVLQPPFTVPTTKDELFIEMRKGQEDGKAFHVVEMGGKKLVKHYQYMRTLPVVGKILDSIMEAGHPLPTFQIMHHAYFSKGFLLFITYESVPDAHNIFQRFGKVFDQTYTRFLDLQKAEAQARESQIEAALERVRSRSMAMQKSGELSEVKQLVLEQLQKLTINVDGFLLLLDFGKTKDWNIWAAVQGVIYNDILRIPYMDHPAFNIPLDAYRAGLDFHTGELSFEEKNQLFEHYFRYAQNVPEERKKYVFSTQGMSSSTYFLKSSVLQMHNYTLTPYTDAENEVLKRIAYVFDQAYTRFLDLQKAEAQAREAQIEAALERVRAKTMAMHNSEDVSNAIATLFTELDRQSIENVRCGIAIIDINKTMEVWSVTNVEESKMVKAAGTFDMNDHKLWQLIYEAWKNKIGFLYYHLSGKEKQNYINILNTAPDYLSQPLQEMPDMHCQVYFFNEGAIWAYSLQPHTEQQQPVMNRFTNVFSQTYLRYRDLQKAEAQAREATIEASLERVRSKTLAMHNSADVGDSVAALFDELVKLGVTTNRCGILIHSDSEFSEVWTAKSIPNEKAILVIGKLEIAMHPMGVGERTSWLNKEPFFSYELTGQDIINYYQAINNSKFYPTQFNLEALPAKEIHSDFHFSEGSVFTFTNEALPTEWVNVFKRFTSVFGQTYRRYLDLQKAEAQALEAIKRASVDRVRAEIASMRTKQDLERITPLIWKELTTLGIPFVRCGVFIMDEIEELIHTFLSTPDGKAIAAFHVPYGSTPLDGAIEFWRKKKIFLTHWGINEYAEFADAFIDKHEIEKRTYYLSSVPKEGIYLHLLPFMQGMLYVGNTTSITEDNLHLVQSVADAFSTAYARYEDFNKIESAKAQVEKTLVDLKQTQAQLIQSEKMASLGELTAGIAHEIQNPLNFVNNFSEVSNELISELKAESLKGESERDKGLEDELLNDIAQNLAKINHHGKRASDIVKGMLEHSRTSTGQKEPTDINALCDDYLRLAYQGLKAKNKDFNATMETHFDSNLPKIAIIPQDMGRVLLNLFNNAFYTVSEKYKVESSKSDTDYEPKVTVSTKLTANSQLLISIKDNGSGIPANIKDKIFQPFFTTKPTGQGTGLGLSLAYDIVKAHGGELTLDSMEGLGTEFTIKIPIA